MGTVVPHVLLFPLPLLGHLSPSLKLAEVLSLKGLLVSVLTTEHVHRRLFGDGNSRWPFPILSISDGLPVDHPRSPSQFLEVVLSLSFSSRGAFRDLLVSFGKTGEAPPVTCAIADGLMLFAAEVAEEVGIPVFAFRSCGPCSFWAYFCIPKLIEAGDIPFPEGCDMEEPVRSVPGMENFLRRRDLPTLCRAKDASDPGLQASHSGALMNTRARGLIFNSAEEVDASVLIHCRPHCPAIYTIGPLGSLLRTLDPAAGRRPSDSTEWWPEDRTCMPWLDAQPSNSVVYISFGSLAVLSRPQLLEFWHGLASSGHRFLWVVRPDLLADMSGANGVPAELAAVMKEKGCVVQWVNQPEVLAHPAVGAFLTHCGWNSTQESICAGVPMICWPSFFDQMINSRFICEVWRIGLEMNETCDRGTVAEAVKQAMEGESAEEMRRNIARLSEIVQQSVNEGGSSRDHLEQLVKHICDLSLEASSR